MTVLKAINTIGTCPLYFYKLLEGKKNEEKRENEKERKRGGCFIIFVFAVN